ncbi:MAG: hypothetical protein AAB393_00690, partial [Bacteroidota bacterium]
TYGVRETYRAGKILKSLLMGSSPGDGRPLDVRARNAFREMAGEIFDGISRSASPDLTLSNLSVLLGAHRFPEQFFTQLKEEGFRKLVLTVCGLSPRVAKGLAKDKLLMELLASNAAALSEPWDGKKPRSLKLGELKAQEETRACIRHLLGLSSFADFTAELTRVADYVMAEGFRAECRSRSLTYPPLAVFAFGKYGTRELTLDADLDVVFIAGQKSRTVSDKLEKIASGVIQKLSAVSGGGRLYDVDARLRPEGKSAPLVVERSAYMTYLQERASLWERQSLTRMRYVCGDEALADEVGEEVESFGYQTALPSGWVDTIVAMRKKMETRSHTRSSEFFDIKLGAGGMVDIEFIAQMIQLKYGGSDSSLRRKPTEAVLAEAPAAVVSADVVKLLRDAYRYYRRLELMIRLTLEERGTVLASGDKLELLAQVVDGSSAHDLRARVASTMKVVRAQFLQICKSLSHPN